MTLKPKNLLSKLIRRYRTLSVGIAQLSIERESVSKQCKEIMAELNEREVVAPGFSKLSLGLRGLRYPIVKTEWNMRALTGLLREKGLQKHCLKVVVDEDAVSDAVDQGRLELEELHQCGVVRTTWGFRVDVVKTSER